MTACLAVLALARTPAWPREIHVSQDGGGDGTGSESRPYRTIGQAASVAQPGDIVLVHGGTYREWVKPPRGGTGEEERITYRAVPGAPVFVKGSERVTDWTHQGGGVWKAELPNAFFGDYNPYALNVSGGWLNYGGWHHRGDVYLSNSEATVFAHNLFVDCGYDYRPDVERRSQFFEPHTTRVVGRKTGTAQDDKWFNNIFVRQGLHRVDPAFGYEWDHNVFLEGARPSGFGDAHSLVEAVAAGVTVAAEPCGAAVCFSVGEGPPGVRGPQVTGALVGVFPTAGQTIEDRHGQPIAVATDINGSEFARAVPGPLADLREGSNTIRWTAAGR